MYRVIVKFTDRITKTKYGVGDEFPCADEARIKELSTNSNQRGYPLIEYVPDKKVIEEPVEVPTTDPIPAEEEPEEVKKPKRGRKKNA